MRVDLKTWLGAALGLAIALGCAVSASAADRPRTPDDVTAGDCGLDPDGTETVCGSIENNESDTVRIENWINANGVDNPPGLLMSCPQHMMPGGQCVLFDITKAGEMNMVQYLIRHAKFDTTYCVRFRSRRMSDGMVSAAWSMHPACVHTAQMPAIPAKPGVSASYTGSTWSNGKQIPQFIVVGMPGFPAGWTQSVSFGDGVPFATDDEKKVWTYTVRPDVDVVPITVCVSNPAGKTCSSQTVSVSRQAIVGGDGFVPPPIKTATALPSQVSLFNGYWTVTSSQGGSFTLDLRLIVDGKMGGEMSSSSDATQKGSLHGRQIDTTHSELIFTQPGLSRGGTIDVTVTGSGDTFTGLGVATSGGAITWTGTKTTRPAAVH